MLDANLDILEDSNCKNKDKYCQIRDKIVRESKKTSQVPDHNLT